MLKPELCHIKPNHYPSWDDFAAAEHPEPWNEFAWFELTIGVEGQVGADLFQALVATHTALPRARAKYKKHRFLVVESFEPQMLETALRKHVESCADYTWDDIVERLRCEMYWEYENYS
jgi:hypothetical protein